MSGARQGRAVTTHAGVLVAARVSRRRRARMIAYGRWEPFMDAATARAHVRLLLGAGMSHRQIGRLADVAPATLTRLLTDQAGRPQTRVRSEVGARLLAVRPPSPIDPRVPDRASVDGTGTRRRLRALVTVGWPQKHLAALLTMSPYAVHRMITQDVRVLAFTARAVAALYERCWDGDPCRDGAARACVTWARRRGAEQGWAPPAAWDDELIDDPSAKPTGVRRELPAREVAS